MALDLTDHVWSVAELVDVAMQIAPEDAPRLPAHEDVAPGGDAQPVDDRQLSLLDWQPRPLRPARRSSEMEQIDLFTAKVPG